MISFVMPVYNVDPALIEEAIDSVLVLDAEAEVVVVDDGSTDDRTTAFLAMLPERDTRISLVRQTNAGVATARNRGIQESSQDWIAFIDPDDRCRAEMAAVLATLADTDRDLVVTAGAGITVAGEEVEHYGLSELVGERAGAELLNEMMSLYLHGRVSASFVLGVPWAKFVRRSVVLEKGILFTDGLVKRSDAEWLIRLYQAVDGAVVVDVPTVDYRLDVPGNISRRFRPEILDAFDTLRTTAMAAPVAPAVLQLYSVELLKDAINSVFSSPAAPVDVASRSAYLDFRARFDISLPLLAAGTLKPASVPRKLLYVAIKRSWFVPVRLLRAWKRRDVLK